VNNLDSIEAAQSLPTNRTSSIFEKQFNKIGFYKAYVSLTRLAGKCNLIIMWKDQVKRSQFTVHSFKLSFNHEGIRTYRSAMIEKREINQRCKTEDKYIEISMLEAAALLQDAYQQNILYNTRPPAELTSEYILLAQDTSNLERRKLIMKLSIQELTISMFTNIYFAALRRMDNGLLYDLSSGPRKSILGDRNEFLLEGNKEYKGCIFLKNSIKSIKQEDGFYKADVFAVLITAREEVVKITYDLMLIKREKNIYVDSFRERGREYIDSKHPDNPFNYRVFCSRYKLLSTNKIRDWLDNERDILLTGELKDCLIYKWLQSNDNPTEEFNINDKILSEYVLTNDEIIIFAKKPYNLIKAVEYSPSCIKLQKKYILPINQLYQYIFTNASGNEDTLYKSSYLHEFCGQSALIFLGDNYSLAEYLNYISEGKSKFGLRGWYFYSKQEIGEKNIPCFKEYYLSKGWLNIYVYGEEIDKEIERLEKLFGVKEKVLSNELENRYDLFNRPISEQKKWHIYGLLQRFYQEKNDIQDLGLVAPLEEVLRTFGAVKTG